MYGHSSDSDRQTGGCSADAKTTRTTYDLYACVEIHDLPAGMFTGTVHMLLVPPQEAAHYKNGELTNVYHFFHMRLQNLYFSQNIIRLVKSRKLELAGNVVFMGEFKMCRNF
jgi:hypothetical protein